MVTNVAVCAFHRAARGGSLSLVLRRVTDRVRGGDFALFSRSLSTVRCDHLQDKPDFRRPGPIEIIRHSVIHTGVEPAVPRSETGCFPLKLMYGGVHCCLCLSAGRSTRRAFAAIRRTFLRLRVRISLTDRCLLSASFIWHGSGHTGI